MCAVSNCLLCFGEAITDFFCLFVQQSTMIEGCAFSYQSDIFLTLLIGMINPIMLQKPGSEGKIRISSSVCEGVCVYIYVHVYICIFMY